jgi:hypothetical protein
MRRGEHHYVSAARWPAGFSKTRQRFARRGRGVRRHQAVCSRTPPPVGRCQSAFSSFGHASAERNRGFFLRWWARGRERPSGAAEKTSAKSAARPRGDSYAVWGHSAKICAAEKWRRISRARTRRDTRGFLSGKGSREPDGPLGGQPRDSGGGSIGRACSQPGRRPKPWRKDPRKVQIGGDTCGWNVAVWSGQSHNPQAPYRCAHVFAAGGGSTISTTAQRPRPFFTYWASPAASRARSP